MKTSEIFKKEIGYIHNETLKEIVKITLDKAPKCIQTIPASSSKRYHPAYAVVVGEEKEGRTITTGGLANHIKAAVGIAHSMIETEIFGGLVYEDMWVFDKYFINTKETVKALSDIVYSALILHDCCKPDDTPKHATRFDHPLKGAELFANTAKEYINSHLSNEEEVFFLQHIIPRIKDCIASHMGQWNTVPYVKGVVLPKPKNSLEWFVHTCDYLASRKYLLFDFDVYNECKR